MSGLCPPVPTELVSVFYLKTGSVQQEQECSSRTSRTGPASFLVGHDLRMGPLCFPQSAAKVSTLSQWPWWKLNFQSSSLSWNPEVWGKARSVSGQITVPYYVKIWAFYKQIRLSVLDSRRCGNTVKCERLACWDSLQVAETCLPPSPSFPLITSVSASG